MSTTKSEAEFIRQFGERPDSFSGKRIWDQWLKVWSLSWFMALQVAADITDHETAASAIDPVEDPEDPDGFRVSDTDGGAP